MNIAAALTAMPANIEPAQPDAATDTGVFAALFGQQLAAPPVAGAPAQSQIRIAPAGEFGGAFTAVPAKPVEADGSAPRPEPKFDGDAAQTGTPATSQSTNSNPIAVAIAAQPLQPLPAPAVPSTDSEAVAVNRAQLTTLPAAVPPVITDGEIAADGPIVPPVHTAQAAPAPQAGSIAEPVDADTDSDRIAKSDAGPAASQATTPSAPELVSAKTETVLPTRPERLAADVGVEIVRQLGANRSEFSIRLDPPDLGRIDVRLEFNRGEVRAVVTTDNPATHDLLRRDAEGLARMLVDNGFRADSGAFRFDLRQDSEQGRAHAHGEPQKSLFAEAEAAAQPIAEPARSMRRGLLDVFA